MLLWPFEKHELGFLVQHFHDYNPKLNWYNKIKTFPFWKYTNRYLFSYLKFFLHQSIINQLLCWKDAEICQTYITSFENMATRMLIDCLKIKVFRETFIWHKCNLFQHDQVKVVHIYQTLTSNYCELNLYFKKAKEIQFNSIYLMLLQNCLKGLSVLETVKTNLMKITYFNRCVITQQNYHLIF